MGANRPSLVVQKFQEIYSQERIEAYDYIVDVTGLEEDIFISAFLLDILKVREREREEGHGSIEFKNWGREGVG